MRVEVEMWMAGGLLEQGWRVTGADTYSGQLNDVINVNRTVITEVW